MAKVYVGIGHGGSDPGAVAGNFEEDALALTIGLACRDELQRHGVTVMTARTGDTDKTVDAKVKEVAENNLMVGDGNGYFRPNDPVTRAEFAFVLQKLRK